MHVISSILVSGILASSTETVSCPLGIRIGTRTAAPLTTCAIKAADRKTDGQTDRQRDRQRRTAVNAGNKATDHEKFRHVKPDAEDTDCGSEDRGDVRHEH